MKWNKWPLFLLALGLSLTAANLSQGALLAYEGFDYPNDGPQLDDRSGGFGWAAGWDDGTTVDFNHFSQDDVSLDSGAFPFAVAGDRVAGSGGTIIRQFNDGILMTEEGNVVYASLLMRKEQDGATAGDNVEFTLGSTTTTNVARIGSTSDDRFFLNFNGVAVNGDPFEFGVNYFLVAKLIAHAAGDDELHLMIFDEDDIIPSTEPAAWDMTALNVSGANIRVARMTIGANALGAMDEIRLGESWSDVTRVPEPATWGMIATGAIAAWGLRRRLAR